MRRDQLSDEELLRRMAGHLKPILVPHIPHETKPEVRYAMGIAWLAAFLGILFFLWATILYPIHYIITWTVFSVAYSLEIFTMLFGYVSMRVNGPVNNLIFTVEFLGTYLLAVYLLIVHARRTPASHDILPHGGSRLTLRGYLQVFLAVLTYLPHLGLVCLGLESASEAESASSGQGQPAAFSGTCLIVAQSDRPISMEAIWKRLSERFPEALPGPEQKGKALLLRILRDLVEVRLVAEQKFDQGQISDRTRYQATDTLNALISRCRIPIADPAAPRESPPAGSAPAHPPRRPEPPPDIARPEPSDTQSGNKE